MAADAATFRVRGAVTSGSTSISAGALMGKGDKRSKKGKIYRGSYGKRRPRKLKKKPAPKRA
jgi:30S ribosomal protein S31